MNGAMSQETARKTGETLQVDDFSLNVALEAFAAKQAQVDAFIERIAGGVLAGLTGVPPGFLDKGAFIWIRWQQGVVGKDGPNGVQVDDVLGLAIRRLTDLQRGKLPCEENRVALRLLQLAVDALASRTRHRTAQGAEATEAPHDTPADWLAVARPLLDFLARVSLSGLALPGGRR